MEAGIKLGLPISLTLHVAVFGGFAYFGSDARPLAPSKVIAVDILTVSEATNIVASVKPPKPQPKIEQPEVMTTPTPMENAQEEAPEVKTKADDVSAEKMAEATLPKETDEPIPERKEDKTPKAPVFDLDKLSGLVDKSRETAPETNQQVALQSETATTRYDEIARQSAGEGSGMSATETDLLVSAMQKCWRMPAAATDAENLRVRLKVNFILGGHVENVQLIDQAASRQLSPGNPFWAQAEREAIAAVHKCAPYDFLPDERYGVWRELVLNLRPEL